MIQKSYELLQNNAPSALANRPSSVTSDKYLFIPSTEIVDLLESVGWIPTSASESTTKRDDFKGFQRHIIKFRNIDLGTNEYAPEFVMVNGHNARVKIQFYMGYDVFICSNGLICGAIDSFTQYHLKEYHEMIMNGITYVIEKADRDRNIVDKAKTIVLTEEEQGIFAMESAKLRWTDKQLNNIFVNDLLKVNRPEDNEPNLWKVYNRIQENMIRGGVRFNQHNMNHQYIDTTRPINQISRDININIGLWSLMVSYLR